jgi:hypothetical protein
MLVVDVTDLLAGGDKEVIATKEGFSNYSMSREEARIIVRAVAITSRAADSTIRGLTFRIYTTGGEKISFLR